MSGEWTFGRKLALGYTVKALVIAIIAVFGYRSTQVLIENDKWVSHSQQVRRELSDLMSFIKDTETSQRGYVATGDERFLEPYPNAVKEVDRLYADVRRLTSDSSDQQRRLDALRPELDAKLAFVKGAIEARRTQGFEAGRLAMSGGEGMRLMEVIRRHVGEMDHHEEQLLEQRRQAAEESAGRATTVVTWGGVLGAIFVVATGVTIARSLTRQVGAAASHVQSSSSELQASANQQATATREQATAMNEITTTITELLATSRQIADSAQRVAQIAEQTTTSARTGDSTVVRGNDAMGGIRRQVDLIVNHMLELGKKSQEIGTVLDIVSELAEQTNILAINATIEAAGAGESGRRFGVVADEIRKLADRVGGSTKEIRGLIEEVRSAVNTTVMTTETGSKAVDNGARQFAEVAGAFRQIVELISTTTDAAREIGLSTKQQATAVEQVNIAINNVSQATKETEVSAEQTLQTAGQLNRLSRDLLRIVQPQSVASAHG